MTKITLDKLDVGKKAKIICINPKSNLKRRFEDLGIIKNSYIKCEFKSPFNDPIAFLIKGTTIAIRCEDAKDIEVKLDD